MDSSRNHQVCGTRREVYVHPDKVEVWCKCSITIPEWSSRGAIDLSQQVFPAVYRSCSNSFTSSPLRLSQVPGVQHPRRPGAPCEGTADPEPPLSSRGALLTEHPWWLSTNKHPDNELQSKTNDYVVWILHIRTYVRTFLNVGLRYLCQVLYVRTYVGRIYVYMCVSAGDCWIVCVLYCANAYVHKCSLRLVTPG